MDGHAIAAEALSYAGLNRFTTEHGGPRPEAVHAGETIGQPREFADRPRRGEATVATRP